MHTLYFKTYIYARAISINCHLSQNSCILHEKFEYISIDHDIPKAYTIHNKIEWQVQFNGRKGI